MTDPPESLPRVSAAPFVVLDTNVVMAWLVFADPSCAALAAQVVDGRMRWIATTAMRDELAHVLSRGAVDAWRPDVPALWNAWDRHAMQVPAPVLAGAALHLRCTDTDDQKFIDLALGQPARWLISRDRAVLKLAHRARAFGVGIVTPERWAEQQPA